MDFDAGQFTTEFATPHGQKLWDVLNREDVIARMETASDLGQPALAPVEDILLDTLGPVIMQNRFKQMAGRMTRQIMEGRGFEHDASDVRLNSVPFYKASRYRRRDIAGLYLFKNSANPRDICLTGTRKAERMPEIDRGQWIFVNYLTSSVKAQIGYSLDLKVAVSEVERRGYLRHNAPRILKRA
jgi:hypothetical protein